MGKKAKDFSGLVFGKLSVLERVGENKRGESLWQCRCECGLEAIVKGANLSSGKTKSCGCINTGPKPESIAGEKFGRLTAVARAGRDKDRGSFWLCNCDCGVESLVRISALRSGQVRSCGCLHVEKVSAFVGKSNPNFNETLKDEDRVDRRNLEEYRGWAKAVKRRDGFKCQVCGESPSGQLVSHHLDNYKDFPELRANVSNGVCLCVKHHLLFHKMFGFKGNTREQFLTFKEISHE